MKQSELNTRLRDEILLVITNALSEARDCDVDYIGANEVQIPVVDAEGNEKYAVIKVSIPLGTRNGKGEAYTPYDGEEAVQAWKDKIAAKQAKAEKKMQEEADRKAVKKAIHNLEKAVGDVE